MLARKELKKGLSRFLEKECLIKNLFSYISARTYVVGTQKNRLNETVLLRTQKVVVKKILTTFRRSLDKSALLNYSSKTYVVGTRKNRLNEVVLLSTQNQCYK